MKYLHGGRIEASLTLISEIVKGSIEDRKSAVKRLEELYDSSGIEPIRGWTKVDIFDKEMCTVYVIAKYGLGLSPDEYPDLYGHILSLEVKAERAAERLSRGEGIEAIEKELGSTDENVVFRIARLAATTTILGFKNEDYLARLLNRLEELLPNLDHKINGFKRFYIAFRVAQAIANGDVRNRLEKETLKHALSMKFNATRVVPSDEFVREILMNVLKVDENYYSKNILNTKGQRNPLKQRGGINHGFGGNRY
ncbi:MAG: DUF2192 domain-containing protein [Thermofilaceae archaeon]